MSRGHASRREKFVVRAEREAAQLAHVEDAEPLVKQLVSHLAARTKTHLQTQFPREYSHMNHSNSTAFNSFVPQQNDAPPESTGKKVARTIVEGITLLFLAQLVAVVLTLLGANFFLQSATQTQGVEKLISGSPIVLVVSAVILAPVFEELIFRGIPNGLMRLMTRPESSARLIVWLVFGLVSSFLFAALHGVKMTNPTSGGLAFQTLPVPQLLVGLWAWHVATLRGLRYSILLHAVFNGIAVGLAFLALALGYKI